MRVFILSFDALEHDFVEKYKCKNLMQEEYGKVDLEYYLNNRPKGRGSGEPNTAEVYSTFLTSVVPSDSYNALQQRMKIGTTPTIFHLIQPHLVIDCPVWGPKSWLNVIASQPLFGRYWKGEISLERVEKIHYKCMDVKAEMVDLIKMEGYELAFIYFKEPDHLQHMYNHPTKYLDRYEKLYKTIDKLAGKMVEALSDEDTLVLFHSDHGARGQGWHSHHGFWSSNKPLGRGKSIELQDWFGLIKEWLDKPSTLTPPEKVEKVFTDEDEEKLLKNLRKMGYFG